MHEASGPAARANRPASERLLRIVGHFAGFVSGAVVVMAMIVAMRVIVGCGSALTGRRDCHSTAGLAVVSTAVLPVADLGEVVLGGHSQLGEKRRVVGSPIGHSSPGTWFRPWLWVWFSHAQESRNRD